MDKNVVLQNINNIKNIVTSKFKEKMWCEQDLEAKRKLRYYKDVINPVNLKKPSLSSTWPTPPKDTHIRPSFHPIRPPHP